MKTILALSVIAGAVLLSAACARKPTEAVTAAEDALAAARVAGADDYAPEAMAAALTAQAALGTELKAQSAGFALTRSYGKATELAAALKIAADAAATQALAAKEQARTEAATLLVGVRAAVAAARQALAGAPKGGAADLGAMHSDLAIIEALLAEIDADVAAGRYMEAKAAILSAQATLDRIIAGAQGAPYAPPETMEPPV